MSDYTAPNGEAKKCACRRGWDDSGDFHVVVCRDHYEKIAEQATATDADRLARQIAANLNLSGAGPVSELRASLTTYACFMRRNALEEAARRMESVNEAVPPSEVEFINMITNQVITLCARVCRDLVKEDEVHRAFANSDDQGRPVA